MRFSARSPSPSPERGKFRGRSSYGLYPESESDPESDDYESTDRTLSESDSDSVESSKSSDARLRLSDLQIARPEQKSPRRLRTDAEMRYIEDAIAAIRLRTHHQDPYEEWEQQTRKDAFRTAKKLLTESQCRHNDELEKARAADFERLSALHAQQTAEVHKYLTALRLQQQKDEQRLRDAWKTRDQILRDHIESGIRLEEEKVRKRLEEERRIKEQRRLEEEKKRLEEEKRRREEEEARRQEEEEARKKAEEKQRALDEERVRIELQNAEKERRGKLEFSTANADWIDCRQTLSRLKNEAIKKVKENKQLKKEWGELRRKITPKIGQLTSDNESVSRITRQLLEICEPLRKLNQLLFIAVLSSLAKAILSQAETEVTAEPRTAGPLAKVTVNLIAHVEEFGNILYSRMVQRVGGLAVPIDVPVADFDGRPWKDSQDKLKAMGYRKGATGEDTETTSEYCTRISGIMRVYFHILKLYDKRGPIWRMFQTPKYWTWFARMLGGQYSLLLDKPAAACLIHTGLAVMGTDAKEIWGIQWIKMLAVIYEGVTGGLPNGPNGEKLLIGGQSPEGKAARIRVLLEIERIMKAS